MDELITRLTEGLRVSDVVLKPVRTLRGRFKEEVNLDVHIIQGDESARLLFLKVFKGRGPYYKPWVEVYGVVPRVELQNQVISFYGSGIEASLYSLVTHHLPPGGSIYVEYYEDLETSRHLELGVPPPATRLGYILFNMGYTWFKDWYYSEGLMEGGQKLQAVKPLDNKRREADLEEITRQLKAFIDEAGEGAQELLPAIERSTGILRSLMPKYGY